MFRASIFAAAITLAAAPAFAQQASPAPAEPTAQQPAAPAAAAVKSPMLPTDLDKSRTSYAIGVAFGRSLIEAGPRDINFDQAAKGMADAFYKRSMELSEAEYRAIYADFERRIVGKMGQSRRVASLQNQEAGQKFLAENKSKQGVVQTADGLQYKIVTTGTGAKPTDDDQIVVNYRGTLVDGTEFDSTYQRNQPAKFKLGGSIAGWREALKLMPVGSKWDIYVPAELAYSTRSVGPVGPNSTLLFEIELLSIEKNS